MKRLLLLLILVSLLGLAACSGGETTSPTTAPTAVPTAVVANTAVPTTVPVALGKLGDPTQCNLVGLLPNPVAGLPPITSADWTLGNPDAKISILEYSDYQ